MKQGLSLLPIGHASSVLLGVTFKVCIVFNLLTPNMTMYQSWLMLLPGFYQASSGFEWLRVALMAEVAPGSD